MMADRTLVGLLPWWLFGYVAAALLVCALAGWWRIAGSLAQVLFGAPAVVLGTVAAQQFVPQPACEVLLAVYLLALLADASARLFGTAATQATIDALVVHGVLRPLLAVATLCLRAGRESPSATAREQRADTDDRSSS